jgi:hypothetical protein
VDGRAAMTDEQWVELGAVQDDPAYFEAFKSSFGVDISNS